MHNATKINGRANDISINLEEAASVIRVAHLKFIITYAKDNSIGLKNVELNLHVPVISILKPDLNQASVWCLSPKIKFSNRKFFYNVPLSLIMKTYSDVCKLELYNREIRIEYNKLDPMDDTFLNLIAERMKPFKVKLLEDEKYYRTIKSKSTLYYMMKSDFAFKASMGGMKYEEYMG